MIAYWEGKKPDYIGLCHETLLRHNPGMVVHTPESIRELGFMNDYLDDPFYNLLCPAHRADIIRIKFLEKYGGFWIDSDFIACNSFDTLIRSSNLRNALYYYRDSWVATNGILIAPKYHSMIFEWSRKIDCVFANLKRYGSPNIPWTSFGADQLKVVIDNAIDNHNDLGWDRVQLVSYHDVNRFFDIESVRDKSWPGCYGYMLFNSTGIPKWFKELSETEILEGKWMISHLFRVALGLDKH